MDPNFYVLGDVSNRGKGLVGVQSAVHSTGRSTSADAAGKAVKLVKAA